MSELQMGCWREAMHIDDLWEGDMAPVVIDGTKLLLVNVDGSVRAYENRCPHQESALDEGDFDGETITCSRHLWEFCANTGAGVNPTSARLITFPCQVEDDGTIVVDVGR